MSRRRDRPRTDGGPPTPSARPTPPRWRLPALPPPAQIRGWCGRSSCRGGSGGARSGDGGGGCTCRPAAPRTLQGPHFCTQRVSAVRCLQTRPGCATCFSRAGRSPAAPPGARRAGSAPATLSVTVIFGGGVGGWGCLIRVGAETACSLRRGAHAVTLPGHRPAPRGPCSSPPLRALAAAAPGLVAGSAPPCAPRVSEEAGRIAIRRQVSARRRGCGMHALARER